jgi:hypothetical protein
LRNILNGKKEKQLGGLFEEVVMQLTSQQADVPLRPAENRVISLGVHPPRFPDLTPLGVVIFGHLKYECLNDNLMTQGNYRNNYKLLYNL